MRHILSGLSETDMVGFTLKKTGVLDTKQPSTATIGRGWRYQVITV